ncbi:MAG: cell filamentation protein Fic [Chitinophagaceae bacterium]|nr:cell filamentation protein Fic [Chitinophagaceae bacterium]
MKALEQPPIWYSQKLDKVLELQKDESIATLIYKINEEYLYWDKIKYKGKGIIEDSELLWAAVKLSRILNAQKLSFGKYSFAYKLTDSLYKDLHEFDLHIGGNLGAKGIIPEDDKKSYLVSSIMEEAIASSQIEGAVTTRKEAKEMLRKNTKPRNKSEQMIVNNYNTIKHIVAIQHEPLTLEKLFEVHRLVTHQTLDDVADEGCFRTDNEIKVVDSADNEVVYTPPEFTEVPNLMKELIAFFNKVDGTPFIHPIVKGCILHFMIGYIHPFVDGNGRTARALFYWYLLKNGYWLTEYLSISQIIVKSKMQYAHAYLYTEIDGNDLTYFIHYKLKTMQQAFESLQKYIQRKISEKKKIIDIQKISGINERQARMLSWLNEEADLLFSVKEIEQRFVISNQTARTDLEDLVDKGYLEIVQLNKKTKAFCRSKNFEGLLKEELKKLS